MKKLFTNNLTSMKTGLLIITSLISFAGMAQRNVSLSKSVNDNGKSLHIQVDGTVNGKAVNYNKSFNVEGLSRAEKEELQGKVMNELGISSVSAPEPPKAPEARRPVVVAKSPVAKSDVNNDFDRSFDRDNASVTTGYNQKEAKIKGFSKDVSFDPRSGVLCMKYSFTKDGVEYISEKTVDSGVETPQKRARIIEEFEKEIGLPR
jgi:hypothetical protein